MALARGRRVRGGIDYWPGFVDALSTMLLAFVFLITIFTVAQFFLSRDVTGKDAVLAKLNKQIEELNSLLAIEKASGAKADASVASLAATLDAARKDNERLRAEASAASGAASGADARVTQAETDRDAAKQASQRALAQVDILNQQIAALRRQLAAIEEALAASETSSKEAQTKIADLGNRLNVALAQKVQELSRYRSDFFGRLRDILGSRPGVRVVGDRFVFQSEVLFESGNAALNPAGKSELDTLANAALDLEREIPPDLPWVLRVDGHTDKRPIQSPQFKSNWDLSAARAIAVVQYLIAKGVNPAHLVAAGFGEFQPIDTGDSDDALRRNRRIELKLTER